ncbi:alkylation response protein AidB-like acyl-CoA dehydrogenase [Bacillus tianshenii]|uniref:Alkylation response protein AidB-like acyl-CoA dehydrogenase n=2 Tax=Sutcliffiella tianshenii TaxID=1463404 RepID=A0ABS2P5A8_9BACI|nr:alkylation response protein AidB-like acyl-CoA dehydrogenase [Bacillus tianshenii]
MNRSQKDLLESAKNLSASFANRAADYDRQANFPFENFNDIKKAGLLAATIPESYGGKGFGLYDFILLQETIAQGDGPTALSLGWHLGTMMNISTYRSWPEETFKNICTSITTENKIINSAHSEAGTGSPARGGLPETSAKKTDNAGWVLNGRKTFTSMAPILDYFIVSATITDTGEVGEFLLPRESKGLSISETWNSVSMRATRSDDLILDNVRIDRDGLLYIKKRKSAPKPQGWLLHIPACYLGIAIAARNEAVHFAETYQPNSLPHPICQVPKVREQIGRMDIDLTAARHFLYSVARKWDESIDSRNELVEELAAVKYIATNTALSVVDEAMRVVGAQSLHEGHPLQRHYRDVRAGLHNPPADDLTVEMMAKRAFDSK